MRALRLTLIAAFIQFAAATASAGVGFSTVSIPDDRGPPIEAGIWYPTDAAARPSHVALFMQNVAPDAPVAGRDLPLVVMSHGHGGSFSSHADTAYALAEAGFVAAALTHPGDNYRDQSRAIQISDRPRQLELLTDYMVRTWPAHAVDPGRIGAFGFSAGGFTVLAAAGGRPDFSLIGPHCAAHPDFYDCRLIDQNGGIPKETGGAPAAASDNRIRAVVVAAPALGFTFASGLQAVTMPVQLWRAADDRILPYPFYAEAVRQALPQAPELHLVEHAGHFDFLAPCSDALRQAAAEICTSEPGFDRAAFHADFNRAIVTFFHATLRHPT
jgi:predicted dienelactone hydrolase